MGYIIAVVVVIVGIVLVAFLLSSRSPRSSRGRIAAAGARTVERSEPSADEPTPAASSTTDEDTASRAQKRTPPS
jgi:FtsZ-interacting cell division protein ZipA